MSFNLRHRIKKILPSRILGPIVAGRWWSTIWRQSEANGMHNLCNKLIAQHGDRVQCGPFAGMRYPAECLLAGSNTSALIGTYEMELHPWLERLRAGAYERVLDIGCAEGYYAVGIAKLTGMRVEAFDPARRARRLCRSMAGANDVASLVRIHMWCSPRWLLELAGRRGFVLSDCEGFEAKLFSSEVVRALSHSDVLIELHDGLSAPGSMRKLLEPRFRTTHNLQVVAFRPRTQADLPDGNLFEALGEDAVRAISEVGRTNQEWLFATPL